MKYISKTDSVLFFIYLVYIALLPIPYGGDWPWALGLYQVLVFLMSAYWLLLYVLDRVEVSSVLRKAWPVYAAFLIWLGYIAFQIFPSTDSLTVAQHLTRSGWLMSLVYAQVFFLTLALINSRGRVRWLAGVIVYSGLFQAVFGGLTALSGAAVATGTFYNRNHLAAYLVMCLAVGIGSMIASLSGSVADTWRQFMVKIFKLMLSPKARLRLYLVIIVICLVLTRSRMGNIAFFASLLIAGVTGLALSRHATRSVIILLSSLLIIDILIVGTWFGVDKVAERIGTISVETEARADVFEYAYELWSENSLTGTGLGTFPVTFPRYRGPDINDLYKQTHNDYLQFATETGIIGILLLGCISLSSLCAALVAQYKRHDPLMRGMSFASIMGITAMLIHATVEFNFQIPPNASMFVVLMAIGWISLFLGRKKKRGLPPPGTGHGTQLD